MENLADRYIMQCYDKGIALPSFCAIFTKPFISYQKRIVPCPYSKDLCAGPEAIEFDTGLVDARKDLGMNLQSHEGVKFRSMATCTVLSSENRTRVVLTSNSSLRLPRPILKNEETLLFDYGPNIPGTNATWSMQYYISNSTTYGRPP